ncbi:hypothetical protein ACHAWU_004612 [Discostella pseudostelligera]|uniref:Fe2OG dioxygenase domain-containing protein n=1 Tax=Discostella pseudostelligera TaxID=259834 RepID=A0ABD3LZK4_9STRA
MGYSCPNVEARSVEEKKEDGMTMTQAVASAATTTTAALAERTSLECSLSSLRIDAIFVDPDVAGANNATPTPTIIQHPTLIAPAQQQQQPTAPFPLTTTAFSFGATAVMPSLLATATATTDPAIISTIPVVPVTPHAHALVNINANATTTMSSNIIPQTPTVMTGLSTAVPTLHHHQHHHQLQRNIFPQISIPPYIPPTPSSWAAQLPALTVQDRPLVPPIYNGINPNYPNAQLLHAHPPIFIVDNFLTPAECDFLIEASNDALGPAPVVGKGSGEVSPSRTSSTCYLAREDLPEYLRKVCLLTGKPPEHCELPQVGRYLPSQQYLQHFDAFDLSNEDGRRFASNGGQRTVTVLVYLNDVPRGGATSFPNLNIEVRPRRGMALVFFPSTLDGLLDKMALHAALPAVDVKYVSQVWIRQSNYEGRPSKRLAQPMGPGLQEMREVVAQSMLLGQLHQQQQQQQQQRHLAQHMEQQLQQGQLQQQHQQHHLHQQGFVQM